MQRIDETLVPAVNLIDSSSNASSIDWFLRESDNSVPGKTSLTEGYLLLKKLAAVVESSSSTQSTRKMAQHEAAR